GLRAILRQRTEPDGAPSPTLCRPEHLNTVMDQEQKLELAREIWQLCKAGDNRIQVREALGITLQKVEDASRECGSNVAVDAGRAMEHFRHLDNERIEQVVEALMPIALGNGSPNDEISDADFDLRLKASYAVLGCIDARCKIFAA